MAAGKGQHLLGHVALAQGHRQLQQALVEKAQPLEAEALGLDELPVEHKHRRCRRMGQQRRVGRP